MLTAVFTRSVRAACALTAALVCVGAAAAAPASAETGPNLKVSATVQQGRWLAGDAVPIDLTITNTGDASAYEVRGYAYPQSGPFFNIASDSWGDLSFQGAGTSFAPGESRTYHLRGSVSTLREGNPVLQIIASGSAESDSSDNSALVTVQLVPADTTDRVAGHLYGDLNRDGLPSPGEDLTGAEAHLIGVGMSHDLVVTTDAAGRFAFEGLPVGTGYHLHFEKIPGGWVIPAEVPQLRLDGTGANTAVEVQAIRPLTDVLQASITLDKASYAVGETGTATITLTNVGNRPLTDLYAGCDPAGSRQELDVSPEQWGAFNPLHPAGELAPGQRLVIKVSGKVPERASYYGRTGLGCYFDDAKMFSYGPYAYAGAKVPGKKADARGQAWIDKNGNGRPDTGEGLAKTKVVLTNDGTHVVAIAQTDANGFATFRNVDVGIYRFSPVGPWTAVGDADVYVVAPPYGLGDWSVRVAPR